MAMVLTTAAVSTTATIAAIAAFASLAQVRGGGGGDRTGELFWVNREHGTENLGHIDFREPPAKTGAFESSSI